MLIATLEEPPGTVVVDVPPDFHQVPLLTDTQERTAAQLQLLDDMGLSDAPQREALSLYLEVLAVRLRSGDVAGTAFCAVQLRGRPSTATITVAVQPTTTTDRGLIVMGAAEALRRQQRYSSVDIVALAQLPAVVAIGERPTTAGPTGAGATGSGATGAGSSTQGSTAVREISVLVPVPGRALAVLVTLSTPCLDDWDVYAALAQDVCRSVHVETGRSGLTV